MIYSIHYSLLFHHYFILFLIYSQIYLVVYFLTIHQILNDPAFILSLNKVSFILNIFLHWRKGKSPPLWCHKSNIITDSISHDNSRAGRSSKYLFSFFFFSFLFFFNLFVIFPHRNMAGCIRTDFPVIPLREKCPNTTLFLARIFLYSD